ncbi:hypothetical protein GUJ93_ZPchr0008g13431 [Zizania palustris]|uniref:Uncharacterized protein n=1 Tax=Zizania palustris TaxID=103762 RepID=A0A8J5RKR9_ZIZPA|nr:hypothetical protein GUJ93_ZPchr0008g13431 [Zizania palustris]
MLIPKNPEVGVWKQNIRTHSAKAHKRPKVTYNMLVNKHQRRARETGPHTKRPGQLKDPRLSEGDFGPKQSSPPHNGFGPQWPGAPFGGFEPQWLNPPCGGFEPQWPNPLYSNFGLQWPNPAPFWMNSPTEGFGPHWPNVPPVWQDPSLSEAKGYRREEAEERESEAITIRVGSHEVPIPKASSPESDRGESHTTVRARAEAGFDQPGTTSLTTGVRIEGPSERRVHKAEGRSTTSATIDRNRTVAPDTKPQPSWAPPGMSKSQKRCLQ